MCYRKQQVLIAAKQPKEWKSYAEQVSLWQARGLVIEDKAAAEKALSAIA